MSQDVAQQLPYLRRYARALTGSQGRGDEYVRATLEVILEDTDLSEFRQNPRLKLFTIFHEVWRRLAPPNAMPDADETLASERERSAKRMLSALPPVERQVYLLHSLERFSLSEVGAILEMPVEDVRRLLQDARDDLAERPPARVLIIEDEEIVSLYNAQLVQEMGHGVAGVAGTVEDAVAMADSQHPDLVLADIRLKHGGSGIEAVRRILQRTMVPVIFVTAHPEDLLTGEGTEPTYVIEKPFQPEELKAAIAQALSFRAAPDDGSPHPAAG